MPKKRARPGKPQVAAKSKKRVQPSENQTAVKPKKRAMKKKKTKAREHQVPAETKKRALPGVHEVFVGDLPLNTSYKTVKDLLLPDFDVVKVIVKTAHYMPVCRGGAALNFCFGFISLGSAEDREKLLAAKDVELSGSQLKFEVANARYKCPGKPDYKRAVFSASEPQGLLHDDAWREVFSHLSLREAMGVTRVCKEWMRIIYDMHAKYEEVDYLNYVSPWSRPIGMMSNTDKLYCKLQPIFLNAFHKMLIVNGERLKVLTLDANYRLTNTLIAISQLAPNLEKLVLKCGTDNFEAVYKLLFSRCKNLTTIVLDGCSSENFIQLRNSGLKNLSICNIHGPVDFKFLPRGLVQLDINRGVLGPLVTTKMLSLYKELSHIRTLTHLKLNQISLPDFQVPMLASVAPNLQCLSVLIKDANKRDFSEFKQLKALCMLSTMGDLPFEDMVYPAKLEELYIGFLSNDSLLSWSLKMSNLPLSLHTLGVPNNCFHDNFLEEVLKRSAIKNLYFQETAGEVGELFERLVKCLHLKEYYGGRVDHLKFPPEEVNKWEKLRQNQWKKQHKKAGSAEDVTLTILRANDHNFLDKPNRLSPTLVMRAVESHPRFTARDGGVVRLGFRTDNDAALSSIASSSDDDSDEDLDDDDDWFDPDEHMYQHGLWQDDFGFDSDGEMDEEVLQQLLFFGL